MKRKVDGYWIAMRCIDAIKRRRILKKNFRRKFFAGFFFLRKMKRKFAHKFHVRDARWRKVPSLLSKLSKKKIIFIKNKQQKVEN